MSRLRLVAFGLLTFLLATPARSGPLQPAGPVPGPDCAAGSALTGYPTYGSPLGSAGHCGTPVASGTINTSTVGQLGEYSGTGTISGITPSGDVTFTSPNFTVAKINGTPLGSTTPTSGNLLVGNGSLLASVAASGDLTLASTGAFTIGNAKVTSAKLAAGAAQGNIANGSITNAQLANSSFTLGSTPIALGAAPTSVSGLTLNSPAFSGSAGPITFGSTVTLSTLLSAPLLGTDTAGNLRAITLGTNLSLSGTTLNAAGGGGGGFTPPATGTIMVSNGTIAPSGLPPPTNGIVYSAGGAWQALGTIVNSVPVADVNGVLSFSTSLPAGLTIPGYLTANQNITLGGDASGNGSTSITVTNTKLNGVSYPASPAANTIPYISASNSAAYGNASTILGVLGIPFTVPSGGSGLPTLTSGAIYKGNGTGNILVSGLSDNGSVVSTSEPLDLTNQSQLVEIPNAGTTGTTNGLLAKLTGAPATAVRAGTADTDGIRGIVVSGGGTTGNAQIAVAGQANCTFDGATTANDWVVNSGTVNGNCHDTGSAARAAGTQVIGQVMSTNGAGGSFPVAVSIGFTNTAGSAPTFPASGSIVVSNGTNSPAGIAPVNGNCIIGTGGAWAAGSCLGGGAVTTSGTSTVNALPFWTGQATLSNTGVPFGTTGNNTLVETTGGGVISNTLISGLPLANLATIADATILSNVSGSLGTPLANTLTSVIDHDIGATRGALLERGASTWGMITPGTSGFVLTSNGTGADPTYQALPSVGISGQAAGNLAIGGSASTITSNIAFSTTSAANTIAEMGAGGLLDPGMLPQATAAAFGAVKCGANTTCTAGVISATAGLDTSTTGIAAAGTTLAAATSITTQQNYVATGANCTTYNPAASQGGCAGQAAVKVAAALMVAGQHIYVTNEDAVNALLVYPDTTGHTINNQAAGLGYAVQANQTALLIVKSATALRTVP